MSLSRCMRLILPVVCLAGLTVLSTLAWRDLQVRGDEHTEAKRDREVPSEPVLGYGLVDVDGGIRRLAPVLPGRVKEVLVRENQEVAAGEVLLRLEEESARVQLRQAQIDLAEAERNRRDAREEPQRHKARLKQQTAAVDGAQKNRDVSRHLYDRMRRIAEMDLCSQEDVLAAREKWQGLDALVRGEQARLEELQLLDPSLRQAQFQKLVEARQLQLELAQRQLEQYVLRAPEQGTVLRILVGRGDVFAATAGQPAVYFCPAGQRIVRAEVSQEWASRLSLGQQVQLQDDEDASVRCTGEIRRIADWLTLRRSVWPGPQALQDQRTAECIIALQPSVQHFRIGQKLRVMLPVKGRD